MERQATTMRVVLDEVFKSNFSVFDNYEDAAKKEQIKKFNYIETIAHQLEKNLNGVNLFEIFPNNNNIITATDSEINELLIKFDREAYFGQPEPEHEVIKLSDEDIEKIDNVFKQIHVNEVNNIEYNIRNTVDVAESRLREYHDYMRNVRREREKLGRLKIADTSSTMESLQKILEDPRVKFTGFESISNSNDCIGLDIVDDVICTHKNERAGIDLRINHGKLRIRLRFVDGIDVAIYKNGNNVNVDRHYHPHVSGSGELCLGNMKDLFEEARQNGDLYAICDITLSILRNYNDSDPYVSLARFAAHSDQIQPNGELARLEPRFQIHECPECGTDNEVEFPAEGEGDYSEWECEGCSYHTEWEYMY
ncbi:MAG: hypothetical protein HWN79_17625 [Candidatus Lokiarchaeota archaeon]|nr:hypothetical protein [Candidatus Lokiarchaeota archaeon]